ncbi:MAG: hypothetical protein U1D30_20220 [Planctomycetota bacterium]
MSSEIHRVNAARFVDVMDDAMADVFRQKTERERLAIAWGMWRSARDMLQVLVRSENPNATQEFVDREVARRLAHVAG